MEVWEKNHVIASTRPHNKEWNRSNEWGKLYCKAAKNMEKMGENVLLAVAIAEKGTQKNDDTEAP